MKLIAKYINSKTKKLIKKLILLIFAFDLLVLAYSFIMPVEFTSEASLFPPKQTESRGGLSSFLQSFAGGLPAISGLAGGENQGQVFAEIAASRSVAEHIITKCELKKLEHLKNLPHEKLIQNVQKSVDVVVDKSGLIFISAAAKSPYFPFGKEDFTAKLSQKIATAAIEGLDSIIKNRSNLAARVSLKYSEKETENYRKKLDSIEIEIQKFQKENKVFEIEEQVKSLINQQVTLAGQLLIAEGELKSAREEFSENSVFIKQLETKVKFLKQQYSQAQTGGMFANDEYSIPFSAVPTLAKEFTALVRDKKIYEQVLLYLEMQKHQEVLQTGKDVSQVEILDSPSLPTLRDAPNRKLMLILGTILSATAGFAYIFWKMKSTETLAGKEERNNYV